MALESGVGETSLKDAPVIRPVGGGGDAKRAAALEAVSFVRGGHIVGLGTGSTAALAIAELGRRIREEDLHIEGVATSYQASHLARQAGVPLRALDNVTHIDLAIDGADQVDPSKNLIKGGGASHVMEKIVDGFADRFIVIVDDSKLVERLGGSFPVPVEVLPVALFTVMAAVEKLGACPVLRMAVHKAGPVVTDFGNLLLDVHFNGIDDPEELETLLNNIPGTVGNGLFVNMVSQVIIGERASGRVRWME